MARSSVPGHRCQSILQQLLVSSTSAQARGSSLSCWPSVSQRRWLMLLTSTRRLSDSRERTSVVLPLPRASKCSTPPFSTSVSRPISPMMPSYAILPSSITPSSVQRKSGRWRDIRYHLIFTRSLPVLLRCSLRRDISLSSSL